MNLYLAVRSILPNKYKGILSKLLILSGLKPKVNKKVVSPLDKGIVTFSVDFEMAWAFRYSKTLATKAIEVGLKERKSIPILLNLFDQYDIPVTWATVGHLFLNECKSDKNGIPHPEMPRPSYFDNKNWLFDSGDWYDHDPCSNKESDPAWYASDLIDKILFSKTKHEIGCHTFSHLDFTYKNCLPAIAHSEISVCKKLAEVRGINLKSFVFPGGTFGNFETLQEHGIACYRKPSKYHIDLPYFDSYGLLAIPSSLGLDSDSYGWSKDFHLKRARKFLIKASENKLVCHFWLHPSMNSWYLENVMPEITKLAGEMRDSGKLKVLTMSGITKEFKQLLPQKL